MVMLGKMHEMPFIKIIWAYLRNHNGHRHNSKLLKFSNIISKKLYSHCQNRHVHTQASPSQAYCYFIFKITLYDWASTKIIRHRPFSSSIHLNDDILCTL
jgi:hypothetical protein